MYRKVFAIFFLVGISVFFLSKAQTNVVRELITPNTTKPFVHIPMVNPPTIDTIFAKDHSWVATLAAERKRTILVTGDVIPARVVNIQTTKFNNFLWPFEKTADIVKDADITYINLESPLIKNCPLVNEGFTFCGDTRHIEGLSYAGVDIVNLANNHIGNFGEDGIQQTVALLNAKNIATVGQHKPLYKAVRGIKFAFLGYNDIGYTPESISAVDENLIKTEITEAKEHADIVIVQYHWGGEYRTQPDERQKYLGRYTIDAGADLVIGNHPHAIQPIEIYKHKLITYAHGNFVFDQEWSLQTKQGVLGKYTFFDNQLVDVAFVPIQIENYGQPYILTGEKKQKILEEMKKESFVLSTSLR